MIEILVASGYDNAICVAEISEQDINDIEIHVNNNLTPLVQKSEVYKSLETFAFLPGHRKLLLSLPQKVKEFQNPKSKKNDENQNQKTYEEIELLTENELEKLKNNLLTKVNSVAKAIGIKQVFTKDNFIGTLDTYISQSQCTNSKPSYKCTLKCVQCVKEVPCTWNGYWRVGNLDRHLKSHIEINTSDNSSDTAINSSNSNQRHNSDIHISDEAVQPNEKNQNTNTTNINNKNLKKHFIGNQDALNRVLSLTNDSNQISN